MLEVRATKKIPFRNALMTAMTISCATTLIGCNSAGRSNGSITNPNPAAANFNSAGSDPQAIVIADQVMEAQGGRAAWDSTRYITFNFFGRRSHLWDKLTGDVRIEHTDAKNEKITYLLNVHTQEGRVLSDAQGESTDPQLLERGYGAWVNDTYWLVMPFKLKDDGVTLKYLGMGEAAAGTEAHVLQLTFDHVGVTPLNKYHVYVNDETHLVEQWDFFMTAEDAEPRMSTPWTNYLPYGEAGQEILLSNGRGDQREIVQVNVLSEIPDGALTSFEPVDWEALAMPSANGL